MKPGRPLAYGKIGNAHFFGLPGNPVSVMVTFYQFVRDALLKLSGRDPIEPLPTFKVPLHLDAEKSAGPHRVPARHPVARRRRQPGACASPANRARASCVDVGSQLLHHPADRQGNVDAGTLVDVQLLEGLI